jgi:hypothetical protein
MEDAGKTDGLRAKPSDDAGSREPRNVAISLRPRIGRLWSFGTLTPSRRTSSGRSGIPTWQPNLPTVRTADGYHAYCRMTPLPEPSTSSGGEVRRAKRGNGAYVLAPPSQHPDGPTYEWVIPLTGELPLATLSDLDLEHLALKRELTAGNNKEQNVLHSQHSGPSQTSNRSRPQQTQVNTSRREKGE